MNTTAVKTRFAPSPTGFMHFGNVRTALFNFLYAQQRQGLLVLRIEDTDLARSEKIYLDSILEDLAWLGITFQEGPYQQSQRQAIYQEYYQKLSAAQAIYPCFCSEEELAVMRRVQIASKQPPRYTGLCRHLTQSQIAEKLQQGQKPTLRFRVPDKTTITFEDVIKGPQSFQSDSIGDFIIQRNDHSASFMFCNAIDDALMGITHALRGDDHLANTPRQLMILQALKLPAPAYGHFPMILGPDNAPLSKRNGSRSIQELRQEGHLPLGLLNYLARLGHYYEDCKFQSLDTLAKNFALKHISGSPAHFDSDQMKHWQKETLNRCTVSEVWQLIPQNTQAKVPAAVQELFAKTIQPNMLMSKDADFWADVLFSDHLSYTEDSLIQMREAGREFFGALLQALELPDLTSWVAFAKSIPQITGKKGKAAFSPLRAALTNALHGPELPNMLELLGKERVKARLSYAANLQ